MSDKKAYRCPECRTRRATWNSLVEHIKKSGHGACGCGGYHYKHRPSSPYCEHNPCSDLLHADRHGASSDDLRKIAQHIIETTPNAAAKVRETLKLWGIE